jgi:hypothetical protein
VNFRYSEKIKIMKIYNYLIVSVLVLLGYGCKSIEMFKENIEVAPKNSYASFVIVNKEIGQQAFKDALLDESVSILLQNQLEALGMVYDTGSPELVIRYGSSEDPRQKEFYPNQIRPMWGWRVWDPWMYNPMYMNRNNQYTSKNYELIHLIVDFIDPNADKMIMRLTAVSEAQSAKEKNKKISKSVNEVVKTYIEHINPSKK